MANIWILREAGLKLDTGVTKTLRLFCFPQAGAGAWVFHGWQTQLPEFVEVMPVELPGRNTRIKEPKPRCMHTLVGELADALAPLLEYASLPPHCFFVWVPPTAETHATHIMPRKTPKSFRSRLNIRISLQGDAICAFRA